jgi:hypothetical protein
MPHPYWAKGTSILLSLVQCCDEASVQGLLEEVVLQNAINDRKKGSMALI